MLKISPLVRRAERLAARLAAGAPKGLVRFLSVGMVGLATHTGVFTLLFRLGLAKSPAWLAGLLVGTMVTWQLNRRMTFAASGRRPRVEMLRYTLVTVVAQGVSYSVFRSICGLEPAFPPTVALIVGAVVATLFSYTGQRFFTFAAPRASDPDAPVISQELPVV